MDGRVVRLWKGVALHGMARVPEHHSRSSDQLIATTSRGTIRAFCLNAIAVRWHTQHNVFDGLYAAMEHLIQPREVVRGSVAPEKPSFSFRAFSVLRSADTRPLHCA